MAVADNLMSGALNAISIYDPLFDENKNYQIRLREKVFCFSYTVNPSSIFFCADYVKFNFELPCIELGNYILEIIDTDFQSVYYSLNVKVF